jgi:hypothetical protein
LSEIMMAVEGVVVAIAVAGAATIVWFLRRESRSRRDH